jgi:hypothetical protein
MVTLPESERVKVVDLEKLISLLFAPTAEIVRV